MKDLISKDLKPMVALDTGNFRDRGFTLIELMMAMVVATIVMAAIYSVYAGLTRSYATQNAAADVQQAVRATIDFMAEDIMMAGLTNPEEDYGATDVGISEAGITTISFNFDRNMDGDTTDEFEDLTFWLDTSNPDNFELKQRDNNTLIEDTFINNVTNFEFRYFRENDTDTPTNNDLVNGKDLIKGHGFEDPTGYLKADKLPLIRTVEILITVAEPAGREGTIQRRYSTRVRRRNADL